MWYIITGMDKTQICVTWIFSCLHLSRNTEILLIHNAIEQCKLMLCWGCHTFRGHRWRRKGSPCRFRTCKHPFCMFLTVRMVLNGFGTVLWFPHLRAELPSVWKCEIWWLHRQSPVWWLVHAGTVKLLPSEILQSLKWKPPCYALWRIFCYPSWKGATYTFSLDCW